MMPTDTDRIYELLKDVGQKLDRLMQDTEKRLSALEERASAERFTVLENRQSEHGTQLTETRTQMKIYAALAGALGTLLGPFLLKLLNKLG